MLKALQVSCITCLLLGLESFMPRAAFILSRFSGEAKNVTAAFLPGHAKTVKLEPRKKRPYIAIRITNP